ncbi:High mobility group box domain containing protein [Amanita muscaria]
MPPADRSSLISQPRRASPDTSSLCDDPSADRCSSSEPTVSQCKPSPRSRSRNRIPRPRNAFMIFRSEFCAEEKISRSVERDHRHISRIIGYYWNKMTEAEKDIWRRKAEQEKMDHLRKYPGYRFTPTVRTKRPAKRNVKRNGAEDLLRCQLLADLLILGKEGNELENAARSLKAEAQARTEYSGHSIKSFSHCPPEGGNVLACSPPPGSNIVDADNPSFHMGLVLDPFKQVG